jgi:hypothetical protein
MQALILERIVCEGCNKVTPIGEYLTLLGHEHERLVTVADSSVTLDE